MQDITVEVVRTEVGEGFLERRFNLCLDGILGVVWERFVDVLSTYRCISGYYENMGEYEKR